MISIRSISRESAPISAENLWRRLVSYLTNLEFSTAEGLRSVFYITSSRNGLSKSEQSSARVRSSIGKAMLVFSLLLVYSAVYLSHRRDSLEYTSASYKTKTDIGETPKMTYSTLYAPDSLHVCGNNTR